ELLTAHDMRGDDAMAVVAAMQKNFNMRQLRASHAVSIALNELREDGTRPLDYVRLHISPTRELLVRPGQEGYEVEDIKIKVESKPVRLEARVRSSFLQAG